MRKLCITAPLCACIFFTFQIVSIFPYRLSPGLEQCQSTLLQASNAASEKTTDSTVTKTITRENLAHYQQISVETEDHGEKVTYMGVPLRTILEELAPEIDLASMPGWKALSRKELVMEVRGADGYPGLVPAIDLAINKSGDRFILATQSNGKEIKSGVQLVCKMDEAHTRWVREVVTVRIISLAKTP